ncbi:MAG TPA: alanine--tRNA ligase, partial [Gemmatimonadales bacterium]|nr:alanine--tRNA ligase [Gemmatimonadales bacterium]
MTAAEIRRKFIEFFKARNHLELPSSSLVPADDPTLLFTNAGMVQFKRLFQGLELRPGKFAVTCQKCVRAGGKHNDLEQVGHTARHHTFFEMLGNFRFGAASDGDRDEYKRVAIEQAWEWVTAQPWLGIAPERLYITVHHTDTEARRLWQGFVPDKRIYGLGDKDNFWQMADTGPAGPNTEIYVDLRGIGDWKKGKADLTLDEFVALQESGALLEIWNLVFMQFDLQADGSRVPLPAPSVDTGAGLERIAAVLQGVSSNFDTDLFVPMIARAVEVVGKPYDRGPGGASYRVLADHARAVAFLLADGVYPSNEGRGYVLRRILRRAVRHAWLLGRREPTLVTLLHTVAGLMGSVYPELVQRRAHLETVTRAEEERFFDTIEGGLARLDQLKGVPVLSGAEAFKLYDTYGFPIDLTQLIAAERGQTVDGAGFEEELARQRTRSQQAHARTKGGPAVHVQRTGEWRSVKPKAKQKWVGYETTRAETDVLKFRQAGERVELVLHENPFYVESGGQVSDTGRVRGEGWELDVSDVEKVDGASAVVGHFEAEFEPTPVTAEVDERRRKNIERNHTATHLVHAAL